MGHVDEREPSLEVFILFWRRFFPDERDSVDRDQESSKSSND